MNTDISKKKPAFTFKELLFAYLAISKLMYWMNNIAAIQHEGLQGIGLMILNRLLIQDIMTIWILVAMALLTNYIDTHPAVTRGFVKSILLYSIGYVVYVGSIVIYTLVLNQILASQVGSWVEHILGFSIFYVIACVVLSIKDRLKKKEAEMYIPAEKINEDSLALLSTLYKRGVLTQEEYLGKKSEVTK